VHPFHVSSGRFGSQVFDAESGKFVILDQAHKSRSAPVVDGIQIEAKIAVPGARKAVRMLLAWTEGNANSAGDPVRKHLCYLERVGLTCSGHLVIFARLRIEEPAKKLSGDLSRSRRLGDGAVRFFRAELEGLPRQDEAHESPPQKAPLCYRMQNRSRDNAGGSKMQDYYDFNIEGSIVCSACGWEGLATTALNLVGDIVEIDCPKCGGPIARLVCPTPDETRAAASAGNPRALADLEEAEAADAEWAKRKASMIDPTIRLPELPGDELAVDWELEERGKESWYVLRCGGVELAREIAGFEDWHRYRSVVEVLQTRYGSRLKSVTPSDAARFHLGGDSLTAGMAMIERERQGWRTEG
jgi:hypothetical protein